MEEKKETTSVKISTKVYEKVKSNKEKTGVPIGTFIEQSVEEKLKKKTSLS